MKGTFCLEGLALTQLALDFRIAWNPIAQCLFWCFASLVWAPNFGAPNTSVESNKPGLIETSAWNICKNKNVPKTTTKKNLNGVSST